VYTQLFEFQFDFTPVLEGLKTDIMNPYILVQCDPC
jgi:hypothetical protein